MKREQLEHLIRAAGAVTEEQKLIIIGSQAILGSLPNAPEELLLSREADIYPEDAPDKSILIDGAIGEASFFDTTFGYYAQGVAPETAHLPDGWRERTVILSNENTRGYQGLCLHPLDIAASKLVAGRDKDFTFVTALLFHNLITTDELRRHLDSFSNLEDKERARKNFQLALTRLEKRLAE